MNSVEGEVAVWSRLDPFVERCVVDDVEVWNSGSIDSGTLFCHLCSEPRAELSRQQAVLLNRIRSVYGMLLLRREAGRIGLWVARGVASSAVTRLELDLYRDVSPFHDGVPPEVISFPQLQQGSSSLALKLPPLLLPTKERLRQSLISESFFLLHKKQGELLDSLTVSLAKTIAAKHFFIAASGDLDIMASGLALLCCGKSMDSIDYFDGLMHGYRGVLRLGQSSLTHDLKTHVYASTPWEHITDEELKEAASEFVGDILLAPAPFIAARCKTLGVHYQLKETLDMSARPCIVESLSLSRASPSSRNVDFDLVCDAALAPQSLVHALGQKLNCGVLLYELEKHSIGPYSLEQAWDSNLISRAFSKAKPGILRRPTDPVESYLKLNTLRYLERVAGKNWQHEWRAEKREKMKPYEKRRRRRERLQMEAEGLISDEDFMKRRLKKKAVKLVANLNVPAIEDVYTQMLEE